VDAGARAAARPGRGRLAVPAWLDPLRRVLDADRPRTFFFRDDDAGWATDRLLALLDVFAAHAVPVDLAVIPVALDRRLAATLRRRAETQPLAFHQHGYAHANHEPSGRPCEFGPARPAAAQRGDISAGALRLAELLGEAPRIFTPPWNRCTRTTGECLLDLGFHVLARDATADPLELDGLHEPTVAVDWSKPDAGRRLAGAAREDGPVGVMLHHALMRAEERRAIAELLVLLTSHPDADAVFLGSLVSNDTYSVKPL
jgi:Uncharacterized protein conserved in bacteria (DUF2334)